MNAILWSFGDVVIYVFSLFLVLSFLWGSFVYYKKAKEVHVDELLILDSIILMGFWSFGVARLVFALLNPEIFWNHWIRILFLKDFPGLSYWGGTLGLILGLWWAIKKTKLKFFDILDFVSLGVCSGMTVMLSGMMILKFSWNTLGAVVFYLILFLFLWKSEMEYRTYEWYKNKKTQARSGFISGLVLGSFGICDTLMHFSRPWWISLLVSLVFVVAGSVLVYIRSGRTLSEDLKIISKNERKR